MITMIIDTLPVFYYEKMVGYMPSSFADLLFAGKRIEVGLRRGKFDYATSTSSYNRRPEVGGAKKKEGDAHTVTIVPTWPAPHKPLTTLCINIPRTNIVTRPISDPPFTRRPSDQECAINHKDLPNITHKIHSLHSPNRVQIPTSIQTLTQGGTS